jgi:glycine betaine catabolism B
MQLTLIEKQQVSSDCITFIFENSEQINWKAGQYFRYKIENPNADDRKITRYFTNAAAPFENKLQITTRFVTEKSSTFKLDLQKLEVGGMIEASGPFGDFTLDDPIDKKYCFIAGGIGITPFRSILLQLDHDQKPFDVTLLYANRNEEIIFKDELDTLAAKNPGLKINYVINPNKIEDADIQAAVTDFATTVFYVSGPEPMVKGIEETLIRLGAKEENLQHDYFPGYEKH